MVAVMTRATKPITKSSATAIAAAAVCALFALGGIAVGCGGGDDSGGGSPTLSAEPSEELLTSAGFEPALDAVAEKAGDDALVLQLQLSERGAVFRLIEGGEPSSLLYTGGGQLVEQEIEVLGTQLSPDDAFAVSDIDPAAIDRIADGVVQEAGEGTELTGLTLEFVEGASEVVWTASARAEDGSAQVFSAELDGSGVRQTAEQRG